jgi:hypothetical protein
VKVLAAAWSRTALELNVAPRVGTRELLVAEAQVIPGVWQFDNVPLRHASSSCSSV